MRLNKASRYRAVEEDGIGDRREGEERIKSEGEVSVTWKPNEVISERMSREIDERGGAESQERMREMLAAEWDDPEIQLEQLDVQRWKLFQNAKLDDTALGSPFLLCLSREPETRADWERLRDALPEYYDTWTVTEDVDKLNFEIECGIKRWMGLNEITRHEIMRCRGFVSYSYDSAPPGVEVSEALQMTRWFRKRRKYMNQNEYRLAWELHSPQRENMPEAIDIELTRTGLDLFKPWNPPKV